MDQNLAQFLAKLVEQQRYSDNTISAYRNDLTQFVDFLRVQQGGAADVRLVDAEAVEAYVANLEHGASQYAPSTIARKIAAVKSFFHAMVEQGVVSTDPTSHLSSPKVKKHIPKTLSPTEVERLLSAPSSGGGAKATRDRALLELLYATGMRVTEVVNLRLDHVDWEAGLVDCSSKGERRRRLPLGAAGNTLRLYVEHGRPGFAREGSPDMLFLNHRGQKLTRQGVWLILKEAATTAGLDGAVTPHTLRHTFAKHKVGAGEDLRRVQELLGHANLSTTQVYRQANRDQPLDDAA
jgi:integrase/recombinase XerD